MKYTLAFDVYGTLINTSGILHSLEELIKEYASPFMNKWRDKQLEYSFRRGLMNKYVDFSVCTRDSLDFCCNFFKIKLNTKQKNDLMNEYTTLPAFDDVEIGLKRLKNLEHRLFAFSNGSKKTIIKLLSHSNIIDYFDDIVSVENTGVFKPSPLVYNHFNEVSHSQKSNSWLISSNPFDVIGAISYGMRSVWVQRSPNLVFDPWDIKPTMTVNSLTTIFS